jgi:hypothetical protein
VNARVDVEVPDGTSMRAFVAPPPRAPATELLATHLAG